MTRLNFFFSAAGFLLSAPQNVQGERFRRRGHRHHNSGRKHGRNGLRHTGAVARCHRWRVSEWQAARTRYFSSFFWNLSSELRRSCHAHPDRLRQIIQFIDIQPAAPQSYVLVSGVTRPHCFAMKLNMPLALMRVLLQDLFQQIPVITKFCVITRKKNWVQQLVFQPFWKAKKAENSSKLAIFHRNKDACCCGLRKSNGRRNVSSWLKRQDSEESFWL